MLFFYDLLAAWTVDSALNLAGQSERSPAGRVILLRSPSGKATRRRGTGAMCGGCWAGRPGVGSSGVRSSMGSGAEQPWRLMAGRNWWAPAVP